MLITAPQWPAVRDNLPPQDYLLNPLIPVNGKTFIHGPPTSGKSAVLWGCLDAMSRGIPYLGLPTSQATCLLISVDMNLYELAQRWQTDFVPPFHVAVEQKFDILLPAFWNGSFCREVREFIAEHKITCVGLDAIGGIHITHSAREDDTAQRVDAALTQWLGTNITIVYVGHDRKVRYSDQGKPLPPSAEDSLGSQMWRSNITSQLHVWPSGNHQSTLRQDKLRVGLPLADPLRLYINLHGQAELWSETRASAVVSRYLNAVRELAIGHLPLLQRDELVAKHCGVSIRTARRWRTLGQS